MTKAGVSEIDAGLREAAIDVIVRTGGRPAVLLERAVGSLARQTAGAIRVILVRHGAADAQALQALVGGALRRIEVIDAPGANRGRAMAAGLAQVIAARFALLDDDDYLLEDHFLHLLRAAQGVAGPAFAYCDILVLDEGAPEAGLRLFREGPAQPPLGHITDRISAHSFLADRHALEGLPFERWGLATAEDALLVASLLARSTPVHTPHATCVYVQGRGDASAYLAHPDRAADELTFAREIAPVRAHIEAKFGAPDLTDEAAYLAPFIAAARHAALFAALGERPAGSGMVAVRDDALATPVADGAELASVEVGPAFEAVAGVSRISAGGGVEVEAPEDFVFAARLPLDLPAAARPVVVAVRVAGVEGAFGLGLAGPDHTLAVEARIDPAPVPLEIQLAWDRPEAPTLIVRRLNALGAEHPYVHIQAVAVAFPCAALAPGGDRARAQGVLAALGSAPRTILSPRLAASLPGDGRAVTGEPFEVELGDAPWAYAFSMPLPPDAARAALRVDLDAAAAPVFVLRVDEAWSAVGERIEAPAGARPNTLWLEPLAEGGAMRLVLQAGPAAAGGRVTLRGVFLYLQADAP